MVFLSVAAHANLMERLLKLLIEKLENVRGSSSFNTYLLVVNIRAVARGGPPRPRPEAPKSKGRRIVIKKKLWHVN